MTDEGGSGPVPVRDLLKQTKPEPAAPAAEPERPALEFTFETEEGGWLVRVAGDGSYGTGRVGAARLLAVHFYHQDDPGTPLREALLPAGRFPHMREEELREVFDRATPIETS